MVKCRNRLLVLMLASCVGAPADDTATAEQNSVVVGGGGIPIPLPPPPIDVTRARFFEQTGSAPPTAFRMWHSSAYPVSTFFSRAAASLQLGAADAMVQTTTMAADRSGRLIYRYQQTHAGIPVEGATYALSTLDGVVESGNGRTAPNITSDATPTVTEATAHATALAATGATQFRWQVDPVRYPEPTGALVYYAPSSSPSPPVLAWSYTLGLAQPVWTSVAVHVDAHTGAVIDKIAAVAGDFHTTGTTLAGQQVQIDTSLSAQSPFTYRLRTTSPDNITTLDQLPSGSGVDFSDADNLWNELPVRRGVSAHWAAMQTWSWLLSRGLPGLDGHGAMVSILERPGDKCVDVNGLARGTHFEYGTATVNLCTFAPSGTGAVDLDVESIGHEIGHGVEQALMGSAFYANPESLALGEHIADVIGSGTNAVVYNTPDDWLMFDKSSTPTLTRNMANPNAQSNPAFYQGQYWLAAHGEEHALAGVGNRWFYLLASGGSGTNEAGVAYNVAGLGRASAEEIVMRALRGLQPSAGYHEYRDLTVELATKIGGSESSREATSVREAWKAVGLDPTPVTPYHVPAQAETGVAPWPAQLSFATPLMSMVMCRILGCSPEIEWQIQISSDPNFGTFGTQSLITSAQVMHGTQVLATATVTLAPSVVYYWRVKAHHADGTWDRAWSWSSSFETSNNAPRHLTPGVGGVMDDAWHAHFAWDLVPFATKYQLQVSPDPTFSSSAQTTVEVTSPVSDGVVLPHDQGLFWRVRAVGPSGGGYSDWSTKYDANDANASAEDLERPFTWLIALAFNSGPAKPTLTAPDDGAKVAPWPVKVYWLRVFGAVSYEAQLSIDDPTFATVAQSPPLIAEPSTSQAFFVDYVVARHYYWRVRAHGPDGDIGEWSEPRSFVVMPGSVAPNCIDVNGGAAVDPTTALSIDWKAIANAGEYLVTLSPTSGSTPPQTIARVGSPASSQVTWAPSLDFSTNYTVSVHSSGPSGEVGDTGTACTFTTIPLQKCGTIAQAGGDDPDSRTYSLGKTSGTMQLQYETFTIPDRITVYYENNLVFDSGCVSTQGTKTQTISFAGTSSYMRVDVTPDCDGNTAGGTEWDYEMSCP